MTARPFSTARKKPAVGGLMPVVLTLLAVPLLSSGKTLRAAESGDLQRGHLPVSCDAAVARLA